MLKACQEEFAGITEQYLSVGEALFGPYLWERYDILVGPPGFPYGGEEETVLESRFVPNDATDRRDPGIAISSSHPILRKSHLPGVTLTFCITLMIDGAAAVVTIVCPRRYGEPSADFRDAVPGGGRQKPHGHNRARDR